MSVAVHDDTVDVLNALDGGSIQGFTVHDGRLDEQADRSRRLGIDPDATPQFTNTPGQVGFTGDGSQLVVTTKANGSSLLVFDLDHTGAPAGSPVVTNPPSTTPGADGPSRSTARSRAPGTRGGPATTVRPPTDAKTERVGTWFPKYHLPQPTSQSGRQDLNLRPLAPNGRKDVWLMSARPNRAGQALSRPPSTAPDTASRHPVRERCARGT